MTAHRRLSTVDRLVKQTRLLHNTKEAISSKPPEIRQLNRPACPLTGRRPPTTVLLVDATLFSFQRSLSIRGRLASPRISFQPEFSASADFSQVAGIDSPERVRGHPSQQPFETLTATTSACAEGRPRPSGALHPQLYTWGVETGGTIPCGGPTCFQPLFENLLRINLLGIPASPMWSHLRTPPSSWQSESIPLFKIECKKFFSHPGTTVCAPTRPMCKGYPARKQR